MSDIFSARLLSAISSNLKLHIKPKLEENESLIMVDIIIRMVDFLQTRHSTLASDLALLLQSECESIKDASKILNGETAMLLEGELNNILNLNMKEMSVGELEDTRIKLEGLVCKIIPILMDQSAETGQPKQAGECLGRIVNAQKNFTFSQDPEIKKGLEIIYRGGRLDDEMLKKEETPPVNERDLNVYLKSKFSRDENVIAKNLTIIPGGFSKLTAFFTLLRKGKEAQQMVIRKDMPVSAIDSTVVDEYSLLCKLHKAGMPVPKPLWLEANKTLFDGAFIVSARSAGKNDISSWQNDPMAAENFIHEFSKILANLHQLDIATLGFSVEEAGMSAGDHMLKEITKYYNLYKESNSVPYPLLEVIFNWLKRNVPEYLFSMPPRIVHADVGFHNMLTEEGKINAVLDWEMSHLGDPAEDLYYAKIFIDQVYDWDKFLASYQDNGGTPCPKESEVFYSIWTSARTAAGCAPLRGIYEKMLPNEIKLALPAYIFGRRLEVDAGSKILQIEGV